MSIFSMLTERPPLGVFGVGQPATAAAAGNRSVPCDGPPFGPSCVQGVGQPASQDTRPKSAFSGTFTSGFDPSFQSRVVGVGQPAA